MKSKISVFPVIRILLVTVLSAISSYCLAIMLYGRSVVYDRPTIRTAILTFLICLIISTQIIQSRVKSREMLFQKYSDVVHVTKHRLIGLLICGAFLFVCAFYLNHCACDYATVYVTKINNALHDWNSPMLRLLFCALPVWFTTPQLSATFIDIKDLHMLQVPGVISLVLASACFVIVMRSISFQRRLLMFKEVSDDTDS